MLDNSVIIIEKEMACAILGRYHREYNCATNMYVAIWRSITSKPKCSRAVVKTEVTDDGPSFLFYRLQHYACTASQIIRSTQAKSNKLMPKMRKGFHWNVEKSHNMINPASNTCGKRQ